jgi:uncharacterized protein YbjQ (UPF0145 family)
MSLETGKCPSCGKQLSSKVTMLPVTMLQIIKLHNPQSNYALCSKCGADILRTAAAKIDLTSRGQEIEALQTQLPIVSAQSPLHWDYETLGIVTAQSVIGTGPLSEFGASISDFFGKNSPAFVKKIVQGEQSGFLQLIQKTIILGGNAVIAVDIDYGEIGSAKGMIMVCMTGTAVRLTNVEVLSEDRRKSIVRLQEIAGGYKSDSELIDEFWKFNMDYLS